MEILAAIIGGIFTLAGIWLQNHLSNKGHSRGATRPEQFEPKNAQAASAIPNAKLPPPVPKKSRRKKGMLIFFGNFIFLTIVVSVFDLNNTEPAWENIFAFFTIGVIPVYSIYLMIKG